MTDKVGDAFEETIGGDDPLPEGWDEWDEDCEATGMTAAERAADPNRAMLARYAYRYAEGITPADLARYDAAEDKGRFIEEIWE